MSFPTDFVQSSTALTDQNLPECRAEIARLADAGFEVQVGLTESYADQIIRLCQEPAIREFCPNDTGKRFKNLTSTANWLAKGRAAFLLVKKNADSDVVAGYGWAGKATSAHVPQGQTTFAIRIGQAGQGQGLATPFAKIIMQVSAKLYGAKGFWLETWQSNGGAVHVYNKLGFKDVNQVDDERPSSNGTVPDIRLYMSLVDADLD